MTNTDSIYNDASITRKDDTSPHTLSEATNFSAMQKCPVSEWDLVHNDKLSPDFNLSIASIEAKRRRKRLQWCSNCGKAGHISKVCTLPVLSCGIIAFQRGAESRSCQHDNVFPYLPIDDMDYFQLQEFQICHSHAEKAVGRYPLSQADARESGVLQTIKPHRSGSITPIHSEPKYLLVRRKDSLNYVEFIRGKYDVNDTKFLYQVFVEISKHERQKILTCAFHLLWKDLWHCNRIQTGHDLTTSEYLMAEQKFNELKQGYLSECGKEISLHKIASETVSNFLTPEWGFPKGKRNRKESDFECAQREFYEETRISSDEISIINRLSPVSETFKGSNNVFYKHKYFIARHHSDDDNVDLNMHDHEQLAEIGDIGWFNVSQALRLFRPADVEKKTLLMRVDNILSQLFFREELPPKERYQL